MNNLLTAPARLLAIAILALSVLSACTSTTVDRHRVDRQQTLNLHDQNRVVLLGRRHLGDYETEADFVKCIGDRMNDQKSVTIIPEARFVDQLYPWFEPRTAPLKLARLKKLMSDPLIAEQIRNMAVQYMIWIDGKTETTASNGSLSCAVGPGGGGCFGFASWDKMSSYEAIIWDVLAMEEKGRISVDAEGSSYMVAVIAPVPFIARVQAHACEQLGNELKSFFPAG